MFVEGATGQSLRANVSWLFIVEHSEVETAGVVERESKTAGLGKGSTSGEQVRVA